MKRIGLIGGLSPASTAHYYEILCAEYNRMFGDLNFPEMTIESLNLQTLIRLFDVNDWEGVADILLDALHRLQSAGADFVAILANTPHNAYEQVRDKSAIPILTIMDATTAALVGDGRWTAALLGTRATMEYGFFQNHFRSQQIETLVPSESRCLELDRIIWKELSHGLVNPESRAAAKAMIQDLASQGAEAAVLGCTELCLLIQPEDSPIPLYDTTRIHAEAILAYALDDAHA